mgnify:CR=1 FL=1
MRLLIIRHGDPDYELDTLTEKGWKEASLLAQRLGRLPITHCYVSPLGRARDTASVYLKEQGRSAEEKDWLQEFPPRIWRPDVSDHQKIAWDWLPGDWARWEEYFRRDLWDQTGVMQEGKVGDEYRKVTAAFDQLLAEHGYVRDGEYYRAEHANRDVIALFCHFGLECVLLSHLMNVSPMILWHHTCAAPSSVTSLYTEERRQGIAVFRMNFFGDISHLYAGEEEPSFKARFCETWDNPEERHD